MSVYKVIARNPKTKRQEIKKVYETDAKFEKYGAEAIYRYQERHDVEVYKLIDDVYVFWNFYLTPRTQKQLKEMQIERNYTDNWFAYKLKDLEV